MKGPLTNDENLDKIFSEIRVRLSTVAQYRIKDAHAREDVIQETVVVLVEKYQSVASQEGLLPFALQILRNKIGDYYRGQQRARRQVAEIDASTDLDPSTPIVATHRPTGAQPDEILEKREVHDRLRRAIDQLGMECQKIFLGLLEDKSRAVLAAELNKSIESLYKQLSRCTEQLRDLLKGHR